jgi:hypothetical protein
MLATAGAQDVPREYQVKAAYLYNFVKLVEWSGRSAAGPIVICVAGHNPFGSVLESTVRGESVNGRPLETRTILEPDGGCHVVFIPRGANAPAYVRAARGTLLVGETEGFAAQGGVVNFYMEGPNVRFEINPRAAERQQVRISARLLQLARLVGVEGATR